MYVAENPRCEIERGDLPEQAHDLILDIPGPEEQQFLLQFDQSKDHHRGFHIPWAYGIPDNSAIRTSDQIHLENYY